MASTYCNNSVSRKTITNTPSRFSEVAITYLKYWAKVKAGFNRYRKII